MAWSDFTSMAGCARAVAAARTEHIGSPFLDLCFPRRDLIGVDVELLRKLSQCSIALDGGKRHLRLESPVCGSGAVVCSLSLLIRGAQRARCQAETPLIALFRFVRPVLTMDASFLRDGARGGALARLGPPEIFNTDQGGQFTSATFIGTLAGAGIRISMDRPRSLDGNVFMARLWPWPKQELMFT